jgi:hypothetical protein
LKTKGKHAPEMSKERISQLRDRAYVRTVTQMDSSGVLSDSEYVEFARLDLSQRNRPDNQHHVDALMVLLSDTRYGRCVGVHNRTCAAHRAPIDLLAPAWSPCLR